MAISTQSQRNKLTSLYLINTGTSNSIAKLLIYETESARKEVQLLKSFKSLNCAACIAQLPNGDLFCFGRGYPLSGDSFIIDVNLRIRRLPSGAPCVGSSAICFGRNIYCFGGYNRGNALSISRKFDLDQNRWINLASMHQDDLACHSAIFNQNILISGENPDVFFSDDRINLDQNVTLNSSFMIKSHFSDAGQGKYQGCAALWGISVLDAIYSIEIDSFSAISYEFEHGIRKILITAEARLYVIECGNGIIYESEVGDEHSWKKVGNSIINYTDQVYSLYNKGAIYIGCIDYPNNYYYKFSLNETVMIKL